MTLFELKFLEPAKDYTSPFPHDPEGFTDTWWIPNIDMPYYDDLGETKLIQFLVDHVEVGRAKITDWCLVYCIHRYQFRNQHQTNLVL